MSKKVVGIMGAEPKEVEGIVALLKNNSCERLGGRDFHKGTLNNQEVVVVYSRCGKTAAATTVTALIHHFGISELVFTGVAGALHPNLKVGDVVVANRLVQHDVDVRPFRPQFEIPILGITFFEADNHLCSKVQSAIQQVIFPQQLEHAIGEGVLKTFNISEPKLWIGDIASGDQFISSKAKKEELLEALPTLLCAEMEGAAVAQVCYEYQLPFTVVRTISDAANESADIDFPAFLEQVASKYSAAIIQQYLQL